MSSAAVIVISSSPTPAFARSPTPAELPSPTNSPGTPSRDGAKRFKTSTNVRDRFSSAFNSARALATKPGAENVLLHSSTASKFKSHPSKQAPNNPADPASRLKFVKKKTKPPARQTSDHFKPSIPHLQPPVPSLEAADDIWSLDLEDKHEELSLPEDEKNICEPRFSSPNLVEKAIPRRLDWTPVKPSENSVDTPGSEKQSIGFPEKLRDMYAFRESSASRIEKVTANVGLNSEQSNTRPRIDLAMVTEANGGSLISKSKTTRGTGKAKARTKAPAKKALTITGLATSAYSDEQKKKGRLPLMLESLTATQAAAGIDLEAISDVSLKNLSKAKISASKARASNATKKASLKSRLVSPTSAMKTNHEQLFMFGSASQLARDESPTLICDTLEALKRSEGLSSDPISPLRTRSFSIESTSPRITRGTRRLIKKRDLWGAAGRDANNALLQVETVDMRNSPAVRQAFAGKDALLQIDGHDHRNQDYVDGELVSNKTPCTKISGYLIDIDDITTPGLPRSTMTSGNHHVRRMHTSRILEETAAKRARQPRHVEVHKEAAEVPSKPKSMMPSYAGWSDHELKKQIAAFGFKPIKKREKMVELLKQCWKDKNGIEDSGDEEGAAPTAPTHGQVLDKVHDVFTRPVLKAKKPRAKRKSDTVDLGMPREPKKRKTAADKTGEDSKEEKVPRKCATKKRVPSDEKVMDVDDIDTPRKTAPAKPAFQRPATPPATIPQLADASSSPDFEGLQRLENNATPAPDTSNMEEFVITPRQTPCQDIMVQIHAAIQYRSDIPDTDTRNHQVSPTWQEKILMFDPIVLEELTVWLNTEGFKAIGEDREVSPLQVRDWCELNGVCCLGFGGGWRGRGKRIEDD